MSKIKKIHCFGCGKEFEFDWSKIPINDGPVTIIMDSDFIKNEQTF